ncbi:MAG: tetratricopeptide repeat protein [Candidatus Omnitrophica bacterium]|nr:tetratricopeptide repeat protein [Candidatus Omnitrophota bacterium]
MLHLTLMRYFFILTLIFFPLISAQGAEQIVNPQLQDQARTYRTQGYKLQSQGDLAGALTYYQKAAELDPTYIEVINDIGVIYEGLNDLEGAIAMYNKALAVNGDYLPTYTNLAFLYEKKGDIPNATYYWEKRYELGQEGEYWREVSAQHLLALGTYPQVKKTMLEKQALRLSKELVYSREQERLKTIEEAKLHFDIGSNLFLQADYTAAIKEFETVLSLNPADDELKAQTMEFYKKAERMRTKTAAENDIQEALNDMKKEDYLAAGEKLKNALSGVFRLAQEK